MCFRVTRQENPTNDQGGTLDDGEQPLALLNEELHQGIDLDDKPLGVQDRGHHEIYESDHEEQNQRLSWEKRLHTYVR